MELNTPRKDPYSSLSQLEETLNKKGFEQKFSVADEDSAHNEKNEVFKASEMSIIELHRLKDEKNKTESTMVIALEADNGTKGILIAPFGEGSDATVDRFLQNVDAGQELNKKY